MPAPAATSCTLPRNSSTELSRTPAQYLKVAHSNRRRPSARRRLQSATCRDLAGHGGSPSERRRGRSAARKRALLRLHVDTCPPAPNSPRVLVLLVRDHQYLSHISGQSWWDEPRDFAT